MEMVNRGIGGGVIADIKRPRKNSREGKCRNCGKKFTALLFLHVGLCGLVVSYLVMGAFAFRALEATFEYGKTQEVELLQRDTVRRIWKITYNFNVLYKENWTMMVTNEVRSFQTELIAAFKDGYDGKEAGSQLWSLPKAFLYSLTVITTIGYGNIAPRTNWGKIATILYAIIGIPLMLFYLTNVGYILGKSLRCLCGRLCSCHSSNGSDRNSYKHQRNQSHPNNYSSAEASNYRVHYIVAHDESPDRLTRNALEPGIHDKLTAHHHFHHEDELRNEMTNVDDHLRDANDDCCDDYLWPEGGDNSGQRVYVPIILSLLILIGYISGGAAMFSFWEGWGYLDASYFCFATLSTIGFGNLVPGESSASDDHVQEKLVVCSLYLIMGLALIATCFNLMQEVVIRKVQNCGRRLGVIGQDREEKDYVG